jgi:long-subunit fatty acid transport protein
MRISIAFQLRGFAVPKRACAESAASLVLFAASAAHATGVTEFPDNGSEQLGRGGAWVARASDPLAAFYNPAGLAGQDTRLLLNANINFAKTCFTRLKSASDATVDGVDPGASYPKVCNGGDAFPNPQIAFAWRVTDRIGLGFAVLGPSASGNQEWPSFVGDKPSPQRYLLLNANAVFLTPTIGAGFEVADGLRLGASLQWGIARLKFSTAGAALNQANPDPGSNDVKADLDVRDYFVPGFTLGGLWSANDYVDVGAWYKWSSGISASGYARTSVRYFNAANAHGDDSSVVYGDTRVANCGVNSGPNVCASPDLAHLETVIPMEAKLGVRVHVPRQGVARNPHKRDPLSQDLFDAELNVTWAHDSAFDDLKIRFPSDDAGNGVVPVAGTPGSVPGNADVPHRYKDVFGVRLGGDANVIPDHFALRAGAFFETRAQDPQYQNIDFMGGSRFGVAGGVSYRLRLGEGRAKALEFSLGYLHVFVSDQSNTNPNSLGLNPLAGSPCASGDPTNGMCAKTGSYPAYQAFRAPQIVNLGTIPNSVNVVNVGVNYRF